MPNQKNTDAVEKLKEKVSKAKAIIAVEYHGLDANKANELKAIIAGTDSEINISKNTLLKIAIGQQNPNNKDSETFLSQLKGPNATIFAYSDALSPIKAVFEFAKEVELPKIKMGLVEGKFVNALQLETLSKLPSKEELLGQLVRSLNAPLTGFVGALGGVQRKFVYAIKAISEKGVS